MNEIYDNKYSFLKEQPRQFRVFKLLILIFILTIFISLYEIKTYDIFRTKGYYSCDAKCLLKTAVPTEISIDFLKVKGREYTYQSESQELKIDEDNMISYYELYLSDIFNLNDGEIVEIAFYYNKQRIIEKLVNMVFKRR